MRSRATTLPEPDVTTAASTGSPWSASTPLVPSVTTSRSSCLPVTSRPVAEPTCLVAVEPVMVPLSQAFTPSSQTWNTTEPSFPTSSSTPTDDVKRVQAPPRLYRTSDEAWTPSPLAKVWPFSVMVTPSFGSSSPLLRSFSAAGAYTGGRELRGPVIEVDGPTVSNTEAWASAHAYLGQTYAGAVGRSQGLLAVQGDLRPTPRILAATRSPAVPKGCYRPLAFGPQDVVILESRSFAGLSERPTLRLLAWDVIGGRLSHVGEVGPVSANAGGFTGAYAL